MPQTSSRQKVLIILSLLNKNFPTQAVKSTNISFFDLVNQEKAFLWKCSEKNVCVHVFLLFSYLREHFGLNCGEFIIMELGEAKHCFFLSTQQRTMPSSSTRSKLCKNIQTYKITNIQMAKTRNNAQCSSSTRSKMCK